MNGMTLPRLSAQTEYGKLVVLAAKLALELGRPVSSKDMAALFRKNPGERPLLFGALGLLLAKASRRRNGSGINLARIGLHGYRAYYAPENTVWWRQQFAAFAAREWLNQQAKRDLPGHARFLLGTEHHQLAANALAGWRKETLGNLAAAGAMADEFPCLPPSMDFALQEGASAFIQRAPVDFVGRGEAMRLLRMEVARRTPWRVANKVNYGRYLCKIRWPQSSLFPSTPAWRCSRRQLESVIASRWPDQEEDAIEESALASCLDYGFVA